MQTTWHATCTHNGTRKSVSVRASNKPDAEHAARLRMCSLLEISSNRHREVTINYIRNTGRL